MILREEEFDMEIYFLLDNYSKVVGEPNAPRLVKNTMLVAVSGVLDMKSDVGQFGAVTDYRDIQRACEIAERHPQVYNVGFLHHSPGGSVVGLNETCDAIKSLTKPTFAYSSTYMASASYALACCCDAVYAAPSAVVGSVGARMVHTDYSGLLKMSGIKMTEFQNGDRKTIGSPYKALTASDRKYMQKKVDNAASEFFSLVKEQRPNVASDVFRSGVYKGQECIKTGLIDGFLKSDSQFVDFLTK